MLHGDTSCSSKLLVSFEGFAMVAFGAIWLTVSIHCWFPQGCGDEDHGCGLRCPKGRGCEGVV